jgi:hypothetical protein
MRLVRCATKVRDGIACRLIEPSSTLRPLWPYRSSNRADRRFARSRCVPGCLRRGPPLKTPGTWPVDDFHCIARGHHRDAGYRAQGQADHNSFTASELPSRPVATWRPRRDSATADKVRNNSDYQPIRGRPSPKLELPLGTALHGTTKSCARATSRRSHHAWGPNGTILLLASCPMSARPNQGIPDLRHQ